MDARKFTEYLLNEKHPIGAGKARFFRKLGYTIANWQELRDEMLAQLPTAPARYSRSTRIGSELYEAIIRINTTNIKTIWEVEPRTGTRLVTAYPLD